jgi:hypothetical protein
MGIAMEEIRERGRHAYSALLFGLARAQRTGILELEHGREWRKVYLVRGTPVLYESSIESERLSKTIVQAGLVAEKPLSQLITSLQPGEQLEDRLVSEGLVGPEELRAHKQTLLERGASAALAWTDFNFRFRANDALGSAIDPALVPLVRPLRGLWTAVKQYIPMDTALPHVADPDAGTLSGTAHLAEVLEAMDVEAPLDELAEALGQDALSFDDLFAKINDKSGHLPSLIWLLEVIGVIHRGGRSHDEQLAQLSTGTDLSAEEPLVVNVEPDETPPIAVEVVLEKSKKKKKRAKKAPKTSPKDAEARNRTASHLPELLATARSHRAGKDFYAFLDLPQDVDQSAIEEAFDRYTKLWQSASETKGLPASGQEDAHALLDAAKKAFDTLRTKKRRKAYDAKLSEGLTPALVAIEGREGEGDSADKAAEGQPELATARALMAQGDHEGAFALLSQLRVGNPSDPAVLSELGWAAWQCKGDESDAGEEYLQLALTFHPGYVPALEKLGQIAQAQQAADTVRDLAERIKKLDANNAWAKEATADASAGSGRGKKKRGFWRRGG